MPRQLFVSLSHTKVVENHAHPARAPSMSMHTLRATQALAAHAATKHAHGGQAAQRNAFQL
jgi:hypothetical protein